MFVFMFVTNVVKMMKRKKFARFQFRLQFFVEWSLLLSLIFQNIGFLSSLFLSKTDESIGSGFVITSSIHGSALTIFCSHGQCNSTFVSLSLSPRGRVVNVNRLEVIHIFALLLSPSVGHLRFSVLLVTLPLDCDSILATFDRCSCGVLGFPVISLPLGFTTLVASGTVNTGKDVWDNQGFKSCFNFSDCIFV